MASPVLVNGATGVLATAIFVRGEDCSLLGGWIYNPSNATAYVQFFDTAVPTVGTTVPKWSVGLETLTHVPINVPAGVFFRGGLWVAATTTAGGSSAPSAALNVNLALS